MFNGSVNSGTNGRSDEPLGKGLNKVSSSSDSLLTIDEVQKTLNIKWPKMLLEVKKKNTVDQ